MKLAFITAIYGGYEKTCKQIVEQVSPFDAICFTDDKNINANGWEVDTTSYHYTHPSPLDTGDQHNSLKMNRHTFNIAKYYKQQFHLIPRLQQYEIVIWLDGTIEIKNCTTSNDIITAVTTGNSLMCCDHMLRNGKLEQEVTASNIDKYTSEVWNDQPQPFQDVNAQYSYYLDRGYDDDKFWKTVEPSRKCYGVWNTAFIAFNMKCSKSIPFLDRWYLQTLKHTTQDQISFPFVCQTMKHYPYSEFFEFPISFFKRSQSVR